MNQSNLSDLDFNWLAPNAVGPDFIPRLLKIQEETPVFWSDAQKGWVLTRYADVEAGLRDQRLSNKRTEPYIEAVLGVSPYECYPLLMENIGRWLFNIDAPEHPRIRRLLIKPFSKASIERHRDKVQAIFDDLLATVSDLESFDLQKDFALKYTASVLIHVLDLKSALDVDRVLKWGDIFATAVVTAQPDHLALAERSTTEMTDLLAAEIANRRRSPGDDLLSDLVNSTDDGKKLTDAEIVSLFQLMLIGGFETTANTLVLAISALQDKPAERAFIADNPQLLPKVVDELNRYTAMLGTMFRIAKEDFVLHGQQIKAGQLVFLMIGAANWDHRAFDEPDTLNFARRGPQPLTFAPGFHMCIGHYLARLQLEVAYKTLLSGSKSIEILNKNYDYMTNFTARTPINVQSRIVNK
ncbi:MAG: cytochrome P450 [Pseudomonadota bacterium]